jgi:pyridoxine 4-dehydrogenase
MTSAPVTAAAAGTWKLGDLTVNRWGSARCALRLTGDELTRLTSLPGRA